MIITDHKELKHSDSLNIRKLSATLSKTPLCIHFSLSKLIYASVFNTSGL